MKGEPITDPPTMPTGRGQVPPWVGLAITLALLAAGAGGLWWHFTRPASSELVEVRPERGPGARGGAASPAVQVQLDGIRQRPNGNYQVHAGDVLMTAVKPAAADKPWTFRFTSTSRDLLTAEQNAALIARMRLPMDRRFAESLKVTEEQLRRLRDVGSGSALLVSPDDQQRIGQLWNAYLTAADKSVAERELISTLRQVGQRSLEPTKRDIAERVRQIQSILTAEQIAAFRQ